MALLRQTEYQLETSCGTVCHPCLDLGSEDLRSIWPHLGFSCPMLEEILSVYVYPPMLTCNAQVGQRTLIVHQLLRSQGLVYCQGLWPRRNTSCPGREV